MLKIGQNWSKIANYPPNAQHKSAPLPAALTILTRNKKQINVDYETKCLRLLMKSLIVLIRLWILSIAYY